MIFLLSKFRSSPLMPFHCEHFLLLYFQLRSCIKNGTASGISQEHLLRAPFLARLYGTKASLQKEDSTIDGNRYLTSHTHTHTQLTCLHPLCFCMAWMICRYAQMCPGQLCNCIQVPPCQKYNFVDDYLLTIFY